MNPKQLAHWLVKQRLYLFIASVLAVVGAFAGLGKLSFTSDYRVFFDKTNEQLVAYEHIQSTYSASDNVVFVLAPKNSDMFTAENLAALQWLTEESWQLPYSQRVESITNFQHTTAQDDDLIVENLVEDVESISTSQIQQAKEIALNETLLVHRLVSETGHVGAVDVRLAYPDDQTIALRETMAAARLLEAQFQERYPQFDTYIAGLSPFNFAFEEVAQQDSERLLPIMVAVIFLFIAVMLRSFASTIITLFVVVTGVLMTMGVTGFIGIQLNNVNTVVPVIILTLAVADCVHILSHYIRGLKLGMSKTEAMEHSIDINLKAVFLTSFTTAVGFLSMNFSESPPFRELGNMAAIGVAFTFLFSVTLLPQLALWLTWRLPKSDVERTTRFNQLADYVIHHRKPLFMVFLVIAGVFMMQMNKNDLNDDNVNYFSKDVAVRQAADFTEANLNGMNLIEYSIDSGSTNGVYDIQFLQKVDDFAKWYRQQEHVTHVYTYTDVIKRLNKNMHNDNDSWYKLPDDRELAAQYSLLYEMSLPFGMDLNNQVNLDKSALRITVSVENVKAKEILAIEEKAQQWFAENAPELASPGASPSIMFAHIGQKNIMSMLWGTLVAVIVISLTLMLSLGSWRLGLLSLIPNSLPALITFGIWGLLVGEINMGSAAVFSITLGIVVDDTVHFLAKFLRARQEHQMDLFDSIHYAFTHVGAALLTTTVVLASGFMILAVSNFNVNSSLGIMVSITIVMALIYDFVFLPALLIFANKWLKKDYETKDNTASLTPLTTESYSST
ncbi:MAG: MMPL family transporter [Pseudomonadales bacterium]|nr:MMPL family transporter [Pseudomonadales bacterium]